MRWTNACVWELTCKTLNIRGIFQLVATLPDVVDDKIDGVAANLPVFPAGPTSAVMPEDGKEYRRVGARVVLEHRSEQCHAANVILHPIRKGSVAAASLKGLKFAN